MSTLLNLVQRAPKRTAAILTAAVAAIVLPATLLAWGPTRPTFTEQVPASYITFNSITNNSFYGDERYFTTIKDAANTANGGWEDEVTVQPGKEYVVRAYVHNNAASNLNLVAKNVRIGANVPTTTGKSISIQSTISADNSNPLKVWDDVTLKSDKNFNLVYVPGSAKFYNNKMEGATLSDSIVTAAGAQLGYESLNGDMPGCYEYSGYVYFKVKPQFAPESNDFTVTKQVKKAPTDSYSESVDVNPGDKVYYRIQFKNTGNKTLNNVNLKDQLPTGISMVPGTLRVVDSNNPSGAKVVGGDNLVASGINTGSYAPGTNAIFAFEAKVTDNLASCGKNIMVNTAIATPEGQSPKEDTADVTASRECKPGETPITELPQTGISGNILALAGIGTIVAGLGYALTSTNLRKLLRR